MTRLIIGILATLLLGPMIWAGGLWICGSRLAGRIAAAIALIILLLACIGLGAETAQGGQTGATVDGRAGQRLRPHDLSRLFAAIRRVESGGCDTAVGDGGRSRGPYQIGRAYWTDSGERTPYECGVWSRAVSERVMVGYWRRYCPKALTNGDWATLARVHNGGPRGAVKQATVGYWQKVKAEMERTK